MLIAAILLSVWALSLALIDVYTFRLPDGLTVPPAAASLAMLMALQPRSLPVALVWPVLYLLVGLLIGGVGGGDIKLALSLGTVCAVIGGSGTVLVAIVVSNVGAVVSSINTGRSPHGPWMLSGCVVAVSAYI